MFEDKIEFVFRISPLPIPVEEEENRPSFAGLKMGRKVDEIVTFGTSDFTLIRATQKSRR